MEWKAKWNEKKQNEKYLTTKAFKNEKLYFFGGQNKEKNLFCPLDKGHAVLKIETFYLLFIFERFIMSWKGSNKKFSSHTHFICWEFQA